MAEVAPMPSILRSSKVPGPSNVHGWFSFKGLSSPVGLLLLAVGACWFLFFKELRGEWDVNAQYNYGYVVPLLGLVLLARRWSGRPVASSQGGMWLNGLIGAGLIFLVLPFQVILEANPEWRLIYWLNGF